MTHSVQSPLLHAPIYPFPGFYSSDLCTESHNWSKNGCGLFFILTVFKSITQPCLCGGVCSREDRRHLQVKSQQAPCTPCWTDGSTRSDFTPPCLVPLCHVTHKALPPLRLGSAGVTCFGQWRSANMKPRPEKKLALLPSGHRHGK